MKKTYISPSMDVIKVNATNIIATSMTMTIIDGQVVNSTQQLGRENISGSNFWEQGW